MIPRNIGRPRIRTPEETKELRHQYYLNNRDRIRAHVHSYHVEHREQRAKYILEHAEHINLVNKKLHAKARLNILTHYSTTNPPSCARCGITDIDVLCLDHKNGGGLKQLRQLGKHSGKSYWNWIRDQGYPLDYQVLCRNCNWKKRINEDGK